MEKKEVFKPEEVFNPSLVTENEDERQELAEKIANFMASDRSMPKKVDDRSGWVSDRLFRDLESVVVQRRDDNKSLRYFADVCKRARQVDVLQNDPSSRALLLIAGVFNALRRVENPNVNKLEKLLEQATKEVDSLPEDTRKGRLDSLLNYNIGIYLRDVNVNYELSLGAQKRAADKARKNGDSVGEAIARLCMANDEVNFALQKGETDKFSRLISELYDEAYQLCNKFTDETPTERTWKYLNAPVHAILAQFWTNAKYQHIAVRNTTINFYKFHSDNKVN